MAAETPLNTRQVVLEGNSFDNPLGVVYESGEPTVSGGRIPQLEFQTINAYGHSWVATDASGIAGGNAIKRVFARSGAATLNNRAIAGAGVASAVVRALGTGGNAYAPNTKSIIYMDTAGNTLLFNGYTTTLAQNSVQNLIRAFLATVSAGVRIENTIMTRTGAWTLQSFANWSAGSAHFSNTPGDFCEAILTVQAPGKVDIITAAADASYGFPSSPFDVSVDGVVVMANVQPLQYQKSAAVEEPPDFAPAVTTVSGITPGVHTIRVTKRGTAATYLSIDAFLIRAQFPSPVVTMLTPIVDYAAPIITAFFGRLTTEAERQGLNNWIKTNVPLEFPNAIIIDPDKGWNRSLMTGDTDPLHPSDAGQAFLANIVEGAMRKIPFTYGFQTKT